MNKATDNKRVWAQLLVSRKILANKDLLLQVVISLIFVAVILVFLWTLGRYWQNTLQPRLYLAAETQAKVLAESKAAALTEALTRHSSTHLATAVEDTIQEMLIIEDPAIGERFIRKIQLQLDYTVVPIAEGALDLVEGEESCETCFIAEVPLISRDGELLGLVTFSLSDQYFQLLSEEMESKLFTESSIVLALLIAVWVLIMVLFHRLNKARKIIEASDLAKTRFMANVTHELRTPLNAILGHTQVYKKDSEMMRNYGQGIKAIDRSADHLLLMINDILEFSRANEEQLALHPSDVDLHAFLSTVIEMTRISTQVKNLDFHHDFDQNLPEQVSVDDKRLRQILLNLLSNAVKFTETGRIAFSVKAQATKADTCRVRFEIQDTGIGIEKAKLQAIFIPFQQLDNAVTRAEGTGLGLTISQRLVGLMGGKLEVESKPSKGSRFWFELPMKIIGNGSIKPHNSELDGGEAEQETMVYPDEETLTTLIEQTKRHSILGLRQVVKELEGREELRPFLTMVRPYVDNYRFKELAEWLERRETS